MSPCLGVFSNEAMENYKSLDAYRFFESGWVQTVYHISMDCCIVFKADVTPSYRTTDDPHHAWVAVDKKM